MEGLPPRTRPARSWWKRLGCLTTLAVVGSFALYGTVREVSRIDGYIK